MNCIEEPRELKIEDLTHTTNIIINKLKNVIN